MRENGVTMEQTPEIDIVDDNAATSRSLKFFLEAVGYRVRTWLDPRQFLASGICERTLGCIILDIRMPDMGGLEVQECLNRMHCAMPVIFLTGHGDVEMAVHAVKHGAYDFLLKPPEEAKLLGAIEGAVKKSRAILENRRQAKQLRDRFETLTPREKDVAFLVARGLMNKVIADRIGIAEKTVQQHRGAACRKLQVRNVAELIDFLSRAEISVPETAGEK